MESVTKRKNVLLAHNPRRSFETSYCYPQANSEVDFSDVFGGPPRLFQCQEMRSSSVVAADSKKLFGEGKVNRGQRTPADGFFDDIFRGDEFCSSPGRLDKNYFCSSSCLLSPALALPPQAEPFDPLLPPKFRLSNLPSKLTKAVDFPVFLSGNRSRNKNKDGIFSGVNYAYASSASSSRFSSQVNKVKDWLRKDVYIEPFNCQRLSSDELSLIGDESPNFTNLRKDSDIVETANNSCQFNFSMYKWASRRVSLLMPVREGNISKLKEKSKIQRCLSSNGRIQSHFHKYGLSEENEFASVEGKLNTQEFVKENEIVNQVVLNMLESRSLDRLSNRREKQKLYSWFDVGFSENSEAIHMNTQEAHNVEGNDDITKRVENKVKMTKSSDLNKGLSENVKKNDGKGVESSNQAEVDENILKLQNKKQNSHTRTSINNTNVNSSCDHKNFSKFPESLPGHSKVTLEDTDSAFQGNILIEELSHGRDKVCQTGEASEDFQVADAKIQRWSNGKKGNIRSLLSTLQYVLWSESGWKAMPLVEIIEGSAVKRAYQKALLCLHPDKLQQKNVAFQQKYVAEKVLAILQDAWDHFNSLGAL